MEVTDSSFEKDVLQSNIPVVVDFWATWCGPCLALAPIIEDVAKNYEGKVKLVKLDVDNNPETAQNYGVTSIPTLAFIKDGKVVTQTVGVKPKSELENLFNKLINA